MFIVDVEKDGVEVDINDVRVDYGLCYKFVKDFEELKGFFVFFSCKEIFVYGLREKFIRFRDKFFIVVGIMVVL